MMKFFTALFIVISLNSFSQIKEELTFKSLEIKLIDFLINKGEIIEDHIKDYKEGKRILRIYGAINNYSEGKLINGIYSFNTGNSHRRVYFVIVENNEFTILNITTPEGLNIAIKNTLEFCNKNNYCGTITNDYISRLVETYYRINKNPQQRMDFNCQKGIKDTKNLP